MACDIKMNIWGSIASVETARELAETFVEFAKPDWNLSTFENTPEAAKYILECIEDGQTIKIVRESTEMDCADVEEICKSHSLSYEVLMTNYDTGETPVIFFWAPDFDEVQQFDADEAGRPQIAIEDITKVFRENLSNVMPIIENFERSAMINVNRATTADDAILEHLKSFAPATVEARPALG